MKVDEILTETLKGIKNVLDSDMIIGKPIYNNDTVVVPITKMTIGFVTATAELEPKYAKTLEGMPLGSLGGGATVNPVGFLVIENQRVRFIPVEGGELDKWTNLINLAKNWLLR
ncbi:MAG TPA: spore germination protein GerW family protein [Clostridia bacterium]|jgi:uncharacterized spore protein YtfJ|nr:spore germination protein GerW family protein [Clostridia bacterium]